MIINMLTSYRGRRLTLTYLNLLVIRIVSFHFYKLITHFQLSSQDCGSCLHYPRNSHCDGYYEYIKSVYTYNDFLSLMALHYQSLISSLPSQMMK